MARLFTTSEPLQLAFDFYAVTGARMRPLETLAEAWARLTPVELDRAVWWLGGWLVRRAIVLAMHPASPVRLLDVDERIWERPDEVRALLPVPDAKDIAIAARNAVELHAFRRAQHPWELTPAARRELAKHKVRFLNPPARRKKNRR